LETLIHLLPPLSCAVKTIVAEENDFANFFLLLQKLKLDMYILHSQLCIYILCLEETLLNLLSCTMYIVCYRVLYMAQSCVHSYLVLESSDFYVAMSFSKIFLLIALGSKEKNHEYFILRAVTRGIYETNNEFVTCFHEI
jgi:hypothetical protein